MALSSFDLILLVITSGITSFITAALGIGGGVMLLAVMASILPPLVLIPVHGMVQLGSNANRAWVTRQHIHWPMWIRFAIGASVGALLASQILVELPVDTIRLAVAGFILFVVWAPKPKQVKVSHAGTVLTGFVTTLVSMFVGASGPLVAAFIHRMGHDKLATTAVFASCMSFQHLLKAAVFGAVGFAFADWWQPILMMILSGAVGTWGGLKLLHKIPAHRFNQIFRGMVTLLALRLIGQVWMS